MERKNSQYPNKKMQSGVVAIEFALGSIFLFYAMFVWVETCFMGFISSTLDYSISEASRTARTSSNADYEAIFRAELENRANIWTNFIDPDDFTVTVKYFSSFDDASNKDITGVDDRDENPIALYRLSFEYSPIFSRPFNLENVTMSREVFSIQEYERDKFSQ
ncbi:TadE/TadG family type IV pilus assembly protein [Enterovibrio norvegicus]|uniref:TadE/TadG family type IV pilus assembly protein n=1 Tax=Enterovibrio norvegicus TaxID=188144 RepID=UPI0024B1DA59|nr:TadE family protein [Enterovibrio norvegicus]